MGEWMEWRFYGNYGKRRIRKYQGFRRESVRKLERNERDQGFRWYEGDGRKQKAPSSYQILSGDHFRICNSDPGRKSDPYASLGNQGWKGSKLCGCTFYGNFGSLRDRAGCAGYGYLLVCFRSGSDPFADPDRRYGSGYGSGLHHIAVRKKDRADAEKYDAGFDLCPADGRNRADDRIYSPGNSGNGTYRCCFSGFCFLWGNGSWKRTLVCTFPFGFGVLQCRF